ALIDRDYGKRPAFGDAKGANHGAATSPPEAGSNGARTRPAPLPRAAVILDFGAAEADGSNNAAGVRPHLAPGCSAAANGSPAPGACASRSTAAVHCTLNAAAAASRPFFILSTIS